MPRTEAALPLKGHSHPQLWARTEAGCKKYPDSLPCPNLLWVPAIGPMPWNIIARMLRTSGTVKGIKLQVPPTEKTAQYTHLLHIP